MIIERFMDYHQRTQHWPQHVLFYRDGVSESQYGMVSLDEYPQFGTAFAALAANPINNLPANYSPPVTLLIVGKRHHTRFLPQTALPTINLPSGTMVDRDVVAPNLFNFYLQSHDSPIGTARPVHYVVIENGCGYNPQQLHEIVGIT